MALIFSELRENWPHLGQGWNHAKLGELSRESECLSRSKKPLRHSERNYPHCSSSCRHRICRRVTQSLGYCFKIHTHYRLSSASHRASPSPSPSPHSAPPSRPWHATSSADTHTETGDIPTQSQLQSAHKRLAHTCTAMGERSDKHITFDADSDGSSDEDGREVEVQS